MIHISCLLGLLSYLLLLVSGFATADVPIKGIDQSNRLTGASQPEEIQSYKGNLEILVGEAHDEINGESGIDTLVKGPGANRCLIDFDADCLMTIPTNSGTGQIFDFQPDDDVVVLRWMNISDRKIGMENIYLNSRGELRMKVAGKDGTGIVDLFQSDMEFRYEADDREVVLRFHRTF